MRLAGTYIRTSINEQGYPEITFCVSKTTALSSLKKLKDIPITIDIQKKKEKRSLNANAYYWILADEIAKQMSIKGDKPYLAIDIYKEHIKDIGAFYMIPIKQEDVEEFIKIWENKGLGWIAEDVGASKMQGYRVLRCWYGSSEYDTQQMCRLIDLAVVDAQGLGIDTLTPEELEEIKHYEERAKDRNKKHK